MRTRVIVAVVCIPILLVVVFFTPPIVFGCLMGLICAIASWEFLRCTDLGSVGIHTKIYTAVCAAAIAVGAALGTWSALTLLGVYLLFAAVFFELIFTFGREQRMDIESVALVLTGGLVIPLMLSSLVRLTLSDAGAVVVMLPFVIAFSSDSGGYFSGMLFGKHKLAPVLSPNKTIEGSAGSFVVTILITLLYGVILKSVGYELSYAVFAVYGFLGSMFCQAGDLAFSAVKRLCGVKDYGSIIPGHGGVLDRFDGIVFVAPLVELLTMLAPAVTAIAG